MKIFYHFYIGKRALGAIRAESPEAAMAAYARSLCYQNWAEIPAAVRPTSITLYP